MGIKVVYLALLLQNMTPSQKIVKGSSLGMCSVICSFSCGLCLSWWHFEDRFKNVRNRIPLFIIYVSKNTRPECLWHFRYLLDATMERRSVFRYYIDL